jgi:hypothetical protein
VAPHGAALDTVNRRRELDQIIRRPRTCKSFQSRRNSDYSSSGDELRPLTRRASMNSHTEVGQWRRWERA